jgi:hypothetical protein
MRARVTLSMVLSLVDRLNALTGSHPDAYSKNDAGTYRPNVGNYHVSRAYGGMALHRMGNEHGGITDVLHSGHISARELYERIHAYIRGIEAGR